MDLLSVTICCLLLVEDADFGICGMNCTILFFCDKKLGPCSGWFLVNY